MGFLQLLKFALLCFDFLAWPAIALGYPLFASIRAIETGSIYHMKKLVIYWTIFSLISLFEFAFVKIIEWFPFWSSVKLLAMFWLVFPRFHGAHYAYQSFIRPYLLVDLQEVIGIVYKPKEEVSQAKEKFLDVADKYIIENGYEALERLIASKMIHKEADDSQTGTRAIEPIEKNAMFASKQVITPPPENKQPAATSHPLKKTKLEWSCHICQVTISCEKKLNEHLQGRKHMSRCKSLNAVTSHLNAHDEDTASAKTKGTVITPPSAENEQQLATASPQKSEVEWGCHICQVTIRCEKQLNEHLQGRKHKSKCKSLNAVSDHLNAISDGSEFKLRCYVCDLKLLDMRSHLRGKEHASNLKKLKNVAYKKCNVGSMVCWYLDA